VLAVARAIRRILRADGLDFDDLSRIISAALHRRRLVVFDGRLPPVRGASQRRRPRG
jgi:hypothetical protein